MAAMCFEPDVSDGVHSQTSSFKLKNWSLFQTYVFVQNKLAAGSDWTRGLSDHVLPQIAKKGGDVLQRRAASFALIPLLIEAAFVAGTAI